MNKVPIKRLYTFMLQSFLPLLLMTFAICWFVVLLQFLWKYVDDMVGKGLSITVLAQMMYYAAMNLVPMALPLGVLLASLMCFGNMGERLELLAMKSAGVPLYRIMKPLFFSAVACAVGLFFFQNHYMIHSQVKFYTILYSARRAAPELDLPEGAFYNDIAGYSLYVDKKNRETGMLYRMMIYDHSGGFGKSRIIVADSGQMTMDAGKTFLTLKLYSGENFENLRKENFSTGGEVTPTPYLRERFKQKEIVIPFDANFNMLDEGEMRRQYVGKNLAELGAVIDSTSRRVDSVSRTNIYNHYVMVNAARYEGSYLSPFEEAPEAVEYREQMQQAALRLDYTLDSLRRYTDLDRQLRANKRALERLSRERNDCSLMRDYYEAEASYYRSNTQEWHSKFTYPVACIIFFFIGAPLGAIIRKGGMGTPIIASVLLFVFYYMINTFGVKMAKTGELEVWQGMWLSTGLLLPLGIFLTYKATRDSNTLNLDAYANVLKRLFGRKQSRIIQPKDLLINEADYTVGMQMLRELSVKTNELLESRLMQASLPLLWIYGVENKLFGDLHQKSETAIEYLNNSNDILLLSKLMDMPILPRAFSRWLPAKPYLGVGMALILPLSLPLLFYLYWRRKQVKQELETQLRALDELQEIVAKKTETNKK